VLARSTYVFDVFTSPLRSRARRRLAASLWGVLVIGIAASLTSAAPSQIHFVAIPAASSGWLDRLNTWRATTGLSNLIENPSWSQGDYNHAVYMVKNDLVTHYETPGVPYYTPEGDAAARNSNIQVSSTTSSSDVQAIDWWMQAPFHAMGMMDPRLTQTGFGSYREVKSGWQEGAALDTLRGNSFTGGQYPVYFPGNGSTEPLTSFGGGEFPDPLQACPGYGVPTGLPVFIEIGGNVATTAGPVHSFTGNGSALEHCVIDSTNPAVGSNLVGRGGVIVIPRQPLQNGVRYVVALTVNGMPYTWSFTVGAFSPPCSLGAGGAPTVMSVHPNAGPMSGATAVTINGCGFTGLTAVTFGAPAAGFTFVSDSQVTAVSPGHAAGAVDVLVTTPKGSSAANAGDTFRFLAPSVYSAVPPVRLLDTRNSGTTLGDRGSLNLAIGGVSVPAGAIAVVINVTAVNESAAGFFAVFPAGGGLPTASNLNFAAGETVPNLVSVGLGVGGAITIYNGVGSADAVVDLEGYYAPSSGGTAGELVAVFPARITDTRAGSGQANAGMTLGVGTTLDVQVTGVGGIPAGASAVVMNVTATNTSAAGFVTVYPTGGGQPLASNLNWTAGVTVPNRVIVPVASNGKVSFYNGVGSADLIVDVNGYFTGSSSSGASFLPLTPTRLVDTRNGTGGFNSPLGQGAPMVVTVAGNSGVPGMGAATPPKAVVLNVTVTGATAASDLAVWPDGGSRPVASDLNFMAGQTVPNLVIVKLSAAGQIDIGNDFGSTNVIVDVVGWFG